MNKNARKLIGNETKKEPLLIRKKLHKPKKKHFIISHGDCPSRLIFSLKNNKKIS